jgi:hypothetical protein
VLLQSRMKPYVVVRARVVRGIGACACDGGHTRDYKRTNTKVIPMITSLT